jgi:hypothetical protein
MRGYAVLILLSIAVLAGCSKTVLVTVPPRMDLSRYGTLGIIQFTSNADATINGYATRQFQEHVQAAQPGTPFLDLGTPSAVLAAVGATQFDLDTMKKIGGKYGVAAVFIGEIVYSEPKTDVRISDITKLEGGMRSEVKGDMSSRLIETRTGASIWSSSAWARRQLGHLSVSAEQGVSASMKDSNPRYEMVPTLVFHLTQDFRATSERRPAK